MFLEARLNHEDVSACYRRRKIDCGIKSAMTLLPKSKRHEMKADSVGVESGGAFQHPADGRCH